MPTTASVTEAAGAGAPGIEERTSRRRAWLWRSVGLLVSLVALAIVLGTVDLSEVWRVLSGASAPFLGAALGVVTLQLVVRGWRWRVVLPSRPGGRPVPVSRTLAPLLVGYLGNAILPARLGEPIRAFLIARRERLDPLESFGATMLERLVDIVSLGLIGFLAAVLLGAAWWIVAVGGAIGLAGLLVLGLLVAAGFTRLADIASLILSRLGLAERTARLQRWARSFARGVDRGRDPSRLSFVVALSLVAWALDALIFYVVGISLGIELTYVGAVLIGAVGVLATAIPAAPGYVGTFELAVTATAVALGVPRAEAVALAVLVHVVTVVPLAFAGAAALISTGSGLGQLAEEAEAAEAGEPSGAAAPDRSTPADDVGSHPTTTRRTETR